MRETDSATSLASSAFPTSHSVFVGPASGRSRVRTSGPAGHRPAVLAAERYTAAGIPTPSFSAAIVVPRTRFPIFWNATSRA